MLFRELLGSEGDLAQRFLLETLYRAIEILCSDL